MSEIFTPPAPPAKRRRKEKPTPLFDMIKSASPGDAIARGSTGISKTTGDAGLIEASAAPEKEVAPQSPCIGTPPQPTGAADFDGATFDAKKDGARLACALDRVRAAMSDGEWWTIAKLALKAHCSEAGASARIRDLRKLKFGLHKIQSRRVHGAGGLHEYRILPQ